MVKSLITNIIIPNNTIIIDNSAFANCTELTSIVIPNSVTSIGYSAFSGCSRLKSITLPFIGDGSTKTHFGYIFGAKTYSENLSYVPKSLKEVIVNGNARIYEYAFYSCQNLDSLIISTSVTNIEKSAFEKCTGLTRITIPFIGDGGFLMTHFGYIFGATEYNQNSDYIPKSLKNVTITGGIYIDSYAFCGCSELVCITLPNSITSIGDRAFLNCNRLVEVYNLSNLPIQCGSSDYGYVGYYAKIIHTSTNEPTKLIESNGVVYYVDELEKIAVGLVNYEVSSIILDNDCASIYNSASQNCSKLINIVIPNSISSIEDNAFNGCVRLVEIYNLSNLPIQCGLSDYGYIGYYAKIIHTSINESTNLIESNGVIYYVDELEKIAVKPVDYKCSTIILDNDCTSIYNSAFQNCLELTNITIPDSVTSIGVLAFVGCSKLVSINIPSNVISIGDGAFNSCTALTSVTIPNSITEIAEDLFLGCPGLVSISLSDSITSIGSLAFTGCSGLISIIMPNSITKIGYDAFALCANLSKVYYVGNQDDWNNITIDSGNSCLTNAAIYYYSETEPTDSGNYWHYVDGEVKEW